MNRLPLLILLLTTPACSDCSEGDEDGAPGAEATANPPPDPAGVSEPENMGLRICVGRSPVALRAALGPLARSAFPAADAHELLTGVDANAPLSLVAAEGPHCVVELHSPPARIAVAPMTGAAPPGTEGAPAGGRWLGDTAAVIGDVLVVGTSREAIERAGAYGALVALDAGAGPALRVAVPEGAIAERLQPLARGWAEDWEAEGRANVARERAAHDAPPELGDPMRALELTAEMVGLGVEALGDLGALEAHLDANEHLVSGELRVQIRPGSALATRAAGWPVAPAELDSLPGGTAVAYFRAGLSEGETTLADGVERLAGDRLGAAEREALAAVAAAVRAQPRTLAIGGTDQGPFVLWRARNADLSGVAEPLRTAFAQGYLATLASAASGCAQAGARLAGRAPGRCPGAPVSALRGSTFVAASAGHAVLLEDGPAELAIGRLASSRPVVAALAVAPGALPAAARLVAGLPTLGPLPASGGAIVTLHLEEDQLVVTLRGSPEALALLFALTE